MPVANLTVSERPQHKQPGNGSGSKPYVQTAIANPDGTHTDWTAPVLLPTANAAVLVAVAFAVASSGNLPVILFTLFWKRFNTVGAVSGLIGGTAVSILLVLLGPGFATVPQPHPAFALANPGIVSIPLGFIFAIVGTYIGEALGGDKRAQAMYPEIEVRSQTGVGAEPSSVAEERVPAAV